jgi:hypothetical protein
MYSHKLKYCPSRLKGEGGELGGEGEEEEDDEDEGEQEDEEVRKDTAISTFDR